MLRRLVLIAACSFASLATSGCCLFHCCHDPCAYDPCGYAGSCGPVGHGGYEGSYGACVTPSGCPECATGMYGACADPVHRARTQRLHRGRGHVQCRGRQPRQYCGSSGYGCPDAYCGDYGDYSFDSGYSGGCEPCDCGPCNCGPEGGHGGMPSAAGLTYDPGFSSGWMPAATSDCQCGNTMSADFMGGGWVEGPWVEESPQSAPQSTPDAEPNTMPVDQGVPNPMPVSHEQYFPPRGNPTPAHRLSPESKFEQSTGSSAIQPVLWVPGGL